MEDKLSFALEQAVAAGMIMRDYFNRSDKHVMQKANHTSVTDADKLINSRLIENVALRYPDHGVLGEEASAATDRRELWVCDPIDGTDAFIIGVPTAMFSLAYVVDGRTEAAVAYDPFLERTFSAIRGRGVFLNGRRLQVGQTASLEGASIGTSASVNQLLDNNALFANLIQQGAAVKGIPGLVYRGTLVAQGRLDGCIALGAAHDFAAVSLFIQEAGGKATDLDGHDQRYDGPVRGIIMSNGLIHGSLAAIVHDYGADTFMETRQ